MSCFDYPSENMKLLPEKIPDRVDLRQKQIFFCDATTPDSPILKNEIIFHTDVKNFQGETYCQNCGEKLS